MIKALFLFRIKLPPGCSTIISKENSGVSFPIYRAYSIDGELLAEVDLSEIMSAIEKPEQNYDESTYKRNRNGRQESTVAFRAMDLHANRMFVSRHDMTIVNFL